ncbi:hypothetical protein [Sphingomonas turrisvirgatae]|uniref:hypothetical protein n=1 Tax=Sphingomonas turrisvirgatae TaxID=1888892 RepID=UPI001300D04C|nr:hypothetical protein [Sphingomonas turrisvirgatae]
MEIDANPPFILATARWELAGGAKDQQFLQGRNKKGGGIAATAPLHWIDRA